MLAIARALMLRPRLLLIDEPSFGLAPMLVQEIFHILRRINEDDGVGMLLVEQNAESRAFAGARCLSSGNGTCGHERTCGAHRRR